MADRAATEAARATFLNCILDVSLASEIVLCVLIYNYYSQKEKVKIDPPQDRLALFPEYLYTDCLEMKPSRIFHPLSTYFLFLFLFVDV